MKLPALALMIAVWTPHLAAQGTVVLPEAPLDSARAALRDDLISFRDSLVTIDAAAARLHRDYRQASEAILLSRARVMTQACTRAARNIPRARQAVLASSASSSARKRSRSELLGALTSLNKVLTSCQTEFEALSRPGQGEQVRGYGNHRAIRVQAGIREYERVLVRYLSAMGIRTPALGSRSSALRS